ncbi:hypothetical protein T09_12725, partial [Trichinella sp. T9]
MCRGGKPGGSRQREQGGSGEARGDLDVRYREESGQPPAMLRSTRPPNVVKRTGERGLKKWKFIPPRAPWMGGYWERLIRTMKESLRKVLGQALLDEEELRTVLCEVGACFNARPLTLVEEEPGGPAPLSPFQLLTGRTYTDLPAVDDRDVNWRPPGGRTQRWENWWRYRQQLIAKWWRLWRSGYLATLHTRPKWRRHVEGSQPNDLVLILEDNVPRGRCPLSVVAELLQGSDGVARAARLRTSTAVITRPVAKLVVLEPAQVDDGRTSSPSGGRMFRPEQHRPSRCDPAKGWYPE